MFVYEKKLQYPVKISAINPRLASIIISQYGGPDGELGASLRYLSQRFSMPTPELKGLRVLRAGLELGELRKNRFAPAHAYALWLRAGTSRICFPEEDPALRRYLAGDVLPSELRGWTLVCTDGCSLGWAKGDGATLKNHYPKALRRPF